MTSINHALGDKKINDTLLNKSFDKWYPELEEKIKKIQDSYFPAIPENQEGDNTLNEILRTIKYISNVVARFNLNLPPESLDFARFSNDETITFAGNDYNHPVQIYINPIKDNNGVLKEATITKDGLIFSNFNKPSGRGVLIEILFYSENDMFWILTFHFHKGDTFVTSNIADIPEKEAALLRHGTIWRD